LARRISTQAPRPLREDGRGPVVDSRERIAESYAAYLADESRLGPASCDRIVFARSEREVADALLDAASRGSEVTVSGARTGIVGGAVPRRGTVLSLVEMNRTLGVRRLDDGRVTVSAEPGISIADLRRSIEEERAADAAGALLAAGPLTYAPDPTEDTAHLGASVATNASGARSFRYGATRAHVRRLRVVLACGEVVDVERGACVEEGGAFEIERLDGAVLEVPAPRYRTPPIKNAAGYFSAPGMDLVDLFVGSEGTLGVITEVEGLLTPRPPAVLSALAFFDSDDDAVAFVLHARGDAPGGPPPPGVEPLALEYFDSHSLEFLRARRREQGAESSIPEPPVDAAAAVHLEQAFREEDLAEAYEAWESVLSAHGSSMERTWGGMEEADLARLRALRHGLPEEVNAAVARAKAVHPEIHKIGTDLAVPGGALVEMVRAYRDGLDGTGLAYVVFGHVGDSHLHLNVMPRTPDELRAAKALALSFARRAVALGGTVSGEHGIGKLKHELLRVQYGDDGLRQMAAVKRALDPGGILNRGVMFPEDLL
jgi:D-lactate dehydrogenase (cytochrome)